VLQVETLSETRLADAALRQALVARGYAECINFAFVASTLLAQWKLDDGVVALANPLSADLAVMRTALLPGLVEAARRNLSRQHSRVRLFETGRVFHAAGDGPLETARLAGLAIGRAAPESWAGGKRTVDFFDLKGDIEQLLATGGERKVGFLPADVAWLHPGRSAQVIVDGNPAGFLGALHPALLGTLDLGAEVVAFELDLVTIGSRAVPRAGEISRFPAVRRDIAVVVSSGIAYAALAQAIRVAAGPILRDLVLFDEYAGQGLSPDTRSLAIGLILQDDSRTLRDHDADQVVAAVVAELGREFAAQLRS
jgi:phenylalanyl-tRNA synthetase beta chain